MAEYRVPTQAELDRLLYMQGMQGKSNQQIIDENLARGTTIQSLPENFFQTASAGARRVGDYVNQAGNVQQIVNKLFPSNIGNTQANVQIPTSFNFSPKQAPTGEILPAGLQTQSVPVASILQAIKPADVLGISGAERAYGDIGAGKAPQPMDVVDTLGVGAIGLGATGGLLKATKGLPVGMSIQEAKGLLQVAPKSDIGFYSAVEQAAMASPRKSATGQAFLNDIMKGQDVRADEIKWMGLDDYLKGKQNVTKQEVQDYIANNRVDVKEVQLGDTKFNKLSDEELINEYIRIRGYDPISDGEALTRNEMLYELGGMNRTESGSTKFGQYTLPGGENYRELLLTMPTSYGEGSALAKEVRNLGYKGNLNDLNVSMIRSFGGSEELQNKWMTATGSGTYRSPHFDQPNILAHLRVNDRVDADGKKMLLIEEVQSDWHQAGREKGYQNPDAQKLKKEFDDYAQELSVKYNTKFQPSGQSLEYPPETMRLVAKEFGMQPDEVSKYIELQGKYNNAKDAVPDAPFKDTWYQLALKRAIQHAAENGYDRIGLTTGSQQAARFDLSKQVDELLHSKNADGTYSVSAQVQGRGQMIGDAIPENKLADYVGKDVAEKIIKGEGKRTEVSGKYNPESMTSSKEYMNSLSGIDLKVGGEGMKKYYDEIYPKFLDKYGKKWKAKIGETSITTGRSNVGGMPSMYPDKEPIRYLDITPEMKAGVSKGQPLFAAVPAIPAAGLLAPQEKRR
jgi:hypothetical protein